MAVKVAVVGLGSQGLMAVKNFREDGFEVTGFESRGYVGGLWKDSLDSTISVHATTVFNTSKFRAAITDFPFAEDVDDFPTATQLHRYLEDYCDHFDLRPHIHLHTRIDAMERVGDKWALQIQPPEGPARTELFDKVALATGSFVKPKIPQIEGIDKFAGSVIHSVEYHGPQDYQEKNVLMLGIHASAQDVAVSLRGVARRVWLSHRQGVLLMSRYAQNGATYDQAGSLGFVLIATFMEKWFPQLWDGFLNFAINTLAKKGLPDIKPEWNLLPAPHLAVSTPLIGDEMYSMLHSGFATSVGRVRRVVGAKSVEMVDGTIISDIDSIIYCTGYDQELPFAPKECNPYPMVGQPPFLYRNIFPLHPDPAIRNSLAFFGQVGAKHPGFVQHEMATMAVSQIWRGKATLPPLREMRDWYRRHADGRDDMIARYGASSTFYPLFVPSADHLTWLDRTAGTGIFDNFGWSWRAWRLWWSDRELYRMCSSGLFTPAIFRLVDMGKRRAWPGARAQIFEDNARATRQQKSREARQKSHAHVVHGVDGKTKARAE